MFELLAGKEKRSNLTSWSPKLSLSSHPGPCNEETDHIVTGSNWIRAMQYTMRVRKEKLFSRKAQQQCNKTDLQSVKELWKLYHSDLNFELTGTIHTTQFSSFSYFLHKKGNIKSNYIPKFQICLEPSPHSVLCTKTTLSILAFPTDTHR